MKKITIITINYNNLDGLRSTFASVFEQTYSDYEYIVIDGGSTDGSKELIQSYSKMLDYWTSEPDNGIYNALNKGLSRATGDYIFCLNSGDSFYSKQTLSYIEPHLETGDSIIYGNSFDFNYPDGRPDFVRKYPARLSFEFFRRNALRHQATFIKRDLHDLVGPYDETFKIVSDWKLLLDSIAIHKATYKYIDVVVCRYDRNGLSSTNLDLNKTERKRVLTAGYEFFLPELENNASKKSSIKDLIKLFVPFGILRLIRYLKK